MTILHWKALKNMIRVVHPGSGCWLSPIPDPGSRGQKGTQSRIRIRNTVFNRAFFGSVSGSCWKFRIRPDLDPEHSVKNRYFVKDSYSTLRNAGSASSFKQMWKQNSFLLPGLYLNSVRQLYDFYIEGRGLYRTSLVLVFSLFCLPRFHHYSVFLLALLWTLMWVHLSVRPLLASAVQEWRALAPSPEAHRAAEPLSRGQWPYSQRQLSQRRIRGLSGKLNFSFPLGSVGNFLGFHFRKI